MRINFACGRRILHGYFNIDAVHNDKAPRPPDLLHEIKFDSAGNVENPIPLPDGCADELFAGHILEHVAEYEALSLVLEWKRLLKTGGRLILELPNIEAAARNLLAGMEPQMWRFAFYGDGSHKDPFMLHKFGYTPKSVKELVSQAGLTNIQILPPQTHGRRVNRDMRVEAIKP